MNETAMLHFALGHLSPDQAFTLHAGPRRYEVTPHTRDTLTRSRRSNAALGRLPDHAITHFADQVQLPGNAPLLLRVTAPALRPGELLDRLVLTAIYLPRRHRAAGLERRRRPSRGRPSPSAGKLAALGLDDPFPLVPDDVIIDAGDLTTPFDAAYSLLFHHAELLTTQTAAATGIVSWIETAAGINDLADSIARQAKAHEQDPSRPNWVTSQPGTDWHTGQPGKPIYVWSDETLKYLRQPLRDTLRNTKNDPDLELQCWTALPGTTQLPMSIAPAVARGRGQPEANYTVKDVTPQSGVQNTFSYDPGIASATISFKNYYVRWLQVSVDQYPPGPDEPPVVPTQALGTLAPVDTIMAVPLPPYWSDFSFTFDDRASRAIVSLGGLGQAPFDWSYDELGIICTAVFNYAVPTMFIALGVAADQGGKGWTGLCKQIAAEWSKASPFVEAVAEGPLGDAVSGSLALEDVMAMMGNLAGSLLLGAIADSSALAGYIEEALGESAAEDAEPFLGWAALAIGAAADVASMIETTAEVASSPATMAVSVERTLDVQLTVTPDPDHDKGTLWPQTATHYVISVTYDDGPVYYYDGAPLPPPGQCPDSALGTCINHTFAGLPAGGNITVLVCLYSDTGWLAGQAKTKSLPAQPTEGSTLVVAPFAIKENLVPLTHETTYTILQKLSFGPQGRAWLTPTSPPVETVSDLDGSNVGDNLWQLGPLAIDNQGGIGYSWAASGQNVPLVGTGGTPYSGQEWTFQAIGVADPQSELKFSGSGYTVEPCLAFPPPTMANPVADGFLLEPQQSGDMLLRVLSLQSGEPLVPSPGQSFGRFAGSQEDLAIHPAGYAVALNSTTCKLQVVRLAAQYPDTDAPAAAILAGVGSRPGLLTAPLAVACGLDRIVVLDVTDDYPQGCVCAFDVKGNPVHCFAGGAWLSGLNPEGSAGVVLVDLSVESKGYLYVLKYLQPVSGRVDPDDYRLDVYNPDGSFLTQVAGLAAARLQVDLWRNVFTVNYEILPGSGRTEPSVAEWIPSTPGTEEAGDD
jgi:hypothetical protein